MTALRDRLTAAKLTPRQTACLAMSHYDGLTHRQIAGRIGIAQPVVTRHIQKALRKLAAAGLTLRKLTRDDEPACLLVDPAVLDRLEAP